MVGNGLSHVEILYDLVSVNFLYLLDFFYEFQIWTSLFQAMIKKSELSIHIKF